MPLIGPSLSEPKIARRSSIIFSGWDATTGTIATDMPLMTSTSKTEMVSSMAAMSDLVPESVSVLRASSARRIVPWGVIGSRMRFISEAATYLSWTNSGRGPDNPAGTVRASNGDFRDALGELIGCFDLIHVAVADDDRTA